MGKSLEFALFLNQNCNIHTLYSRIATYKKAPRDLLLFLDKNQENLIQWDYWVFSSADMRL